MIAIIPARGGSKGLPNKNIRLLNDKPLIAYTILEALKVKEISRVIVSTDSEKIAEVALKYGAEVPFIRPKELAEDNSLAIDNYIYTIDRLQKEQKYTINDFIVLQPTSPLRKAWHIEEAIELFKKRNADSIISYTEEDHPIYWHKFINNDLTLVDIFNEKISNRQDYKKTFYPNGAIYIFKVNLIKNKKYFSDRTFAYIMDKFYSIDIDTKYDFDLAEFLINKEYEKFNN